MAIFSFAILPFTLLALIEIKIGDSGFLRDENLDTRRIGNLDPENEFDSYKNELSIWDIRQSFSIKMTSIYRLIF